VSSLPQRLSSRSFTPLRVVGHFSVHCVRDTFLFQKKSTVSRTPPSATPTSPTSGTVSSLSNQLQHQPTQASPTPTSPTLAIDSYITGFSNRLRHQLAQASATPASTASTIRDSCITDISNRLLHHQLQQPNPATPDSIISIPSIN
jgi:hypothetical protein